MSAVLVLGAASAGLHAAPASAGDLDRARERAVRWAMTQVGHRERGTTNRSPRIDGWTRGMGLRVPPARPWCGAFVHAAFKRAGVRLSARLIDPDRTYEDAQEGRRGLRAIPIRSVRRGDLLLFRIRRGLRASHLAIARDRPRGGRIATVEGNVSHAVRTRARGVGVPVMAVRVTG